MYMGVKFIHLVYFLFDLIPLWMQVKKLKRTKKHRQRVSENQEGEKKTLEHREDAK